MALNSLSCQVGQVDQLLLMDLVVPENKQENRKCRMPLKDNKTKKIYIYT